MVEPVAPDASMRFQVRDVRVLITGAAHGLGRATATAFAGAGARVAALDVESAPMAELREGHAIEHVVQADVDDDTSVRRAVSEVIDRLSGLDVVVNAAARFPTGSLDDEFPDLLMDVLGTNVGGTARVIAAARDALSASDVARIVNFASITFMTGVPPGLAGYIASKGGIIGLTRALARELGPSGIGVNAIAPGAFPTRAEDIVADRAAYTEQILSSQCLKRRGTVADIACAALFLASPASSFITGQTLVVDGGWVFN